MLDVKELAMYIVTKYKQDFNKNISSVKLNKALYFVFAYWGGNMTYIKSQYKTGLEYDVELSDYTETLFDSKIEAWTYGPAIPEVYFLFIEDKLSKYYNENLFNDKDYLKEFLNEILNDVLDVGDFRLVGLSQQDKCWKKNWKFKYIHNPKEINKKDIIKEYKKIYKENS